MLVPGCLDLVLHSCIPHVLYLDLLCFNNLYIFVIMHSDVVNASAAGDDLESTKLKLGGRRIVKRCTRGTMSVGQTNRRFLARLHADQRELFRQFPNVSDTHFASVVVMILKRKPPSFFFLFSFFLPILFFFFF
jgi:hypothetical protein